MNRTLPEKISCIVTSNCCPVEGVIIRAILQTDLKNCYSSIFGPTDKEGFASLERQAILHDAAENCKFGLQDYRPIEKSFTGLVFISIMDEVQLKGVLGAYELYKKYTEYPLNFKKNIENGIEVISRADMRNLKVEVDAIPEVIQVLVRK